MKYLYKVCVLLLVSSMVNSQVTMQINMPRSIAANSENLFQVKIIKGNMTNYSKFELSVPEGATIKEKDNKGGTFVFTDQHAKIIWAITPEENELIIEMVLVAPATNGTYSIKQNYYYLENEDKNEFEVEPYVFNVVDAADIQYEQTDFINLKTFVPASIEVPVAKTINMDSKNPEEIKFQEYQLKKDAADAFKIGATEKKKALENLEDANTILRQADYLGDDISEKISKQANAAKKRANLDLEIANKILALAQSLEDDANKMQKLNVRNNNTTKDGSIANKTASAEPISGNLVYKLQLGAFGKSPSKSEFQNAGNVVIINENGLYKVIMGNFTSKEEALQKREQVIGKGFDAFVVGYKDGVRIQ